MRSQWTTTGVKGDVLGESKPLDVRRGSEGGLKGVWRTDRSEIELQLASRLVPLKGPREFKQRKVACCDPECARAPRI
eukprot:1184535-Prorocentrum_minimum.AAC.2